MKRKVSVIALISVLIVTLVGSSMVFAVSSSTKLKNIESQKSSAKKSLAEVEEMMDTLTDQLDEINAKVDAKRIQLNKATKEVKDTKKKIEERKAGLNARLRAMYKNGTVGYIEVILGSGSISEFISNIEMVKRIYKGDQKVLETLAKQKEELEKKEAKLKKEKKALDALQAKAKAKQQAIAQKKAAYKAQIAKLEREAQAIRADIARRQNPNSVYHGNGQFAWPAPSTRLITSQFGLRPNPFGGGGMEGHAGIDIGISYGTVVAADSGRVIVAQTGYYGYGTAIVIDHGSGLSTIYGHLSSLKVKVGQHVSKGQAIAISGNTGRSTGPHLHFEVQQYGTPVSPWKYL
ncbi:MAG: peptidoglycan DD-metalloendopeptidase family protein [Clostridia bacterium]|nr:peptidoglycan DD-metalloendopeptidase family protein [Clostridia bacterium]